VAKTVDSLGKNLASKVINNKFAFSIIHRVFFSLPHPMYPSG
jgi:hypothetical protein